MISITIDNIEYRFFDHLYAVSKCGKVLRNLKPYTPTLRGDGYLCLGRQRLMHRVVATCWLDGSHKSKHVHHINGDKSDNRSENLEWVTPKVHFGDRHDGACGKYIRTVETRNKMRDIRTGTKDSEEIRNKKASILAVVGPKRQCIYQDTIYPSVAAAAKVVGIPPSTFRLRCNSKNYPEYKLIL